MVSYPPSTLGMGSVMKVVTCDVSGSILRTQLSSLLQGGAKHHPVGRLDSPSHPLESLLRGVSWNPHYTRADSGPTKSISLGWMSTCTTRFAFPATGQINSECKKLRIYENTARKLAKCMLFNALTKNNSLSLMAHIFGCSTIHSMTEWSILFYI